MKANDALSDESRLDALLREARVAPGLPPRFQPEVWRRIEAAEAPAASESWLERLANWSLRPRLAWTSAAVMLLAGALAGALEGRQAARHDAQMNYLAFVAPASAR